MKRKTIISLLFFIPILSLIFSYIYLALYHNTLNLSTIIIHENARLNLLGTMFFFEHFVGQLPILITFSLFITGSFLYFNSYSKPHIKKKHLFLLSLFLILILAVAFAGSIINVGLDETINILAQNKERDNVYSYGGNWKLALTSTITTVFIIFSFAVWLRLLLNQQFKKNKNIILFIAFALLIGISIILAVDLNSFTNSKFIMHNVREIVLNTLMLIPIGFGALLLVECCSKKSLDWIFIKKNLHHITIWPLTAIFLFLYHLILASNINLADVSQSPSLPILHLLSSHFFEHSLDYIFLPLFCILIYLITLYLMNNQNQ